jgi:dihydrofolate reductase
VSASVLYMSMSLDGYIAGPNDEVGNPGGDGFDRLHEWFAPGGGEFVRPSGQAGELFDEMEAVGAVLAGRRTVEQVDHWEVTITVSRSSCPVTGRQARPSRSIRW